MGNQIHALRILIAQVRESDTHLKSWRGFHSEPATQTDRMEAVNVSDGRRPPGTQYFRKHQITI